MEALTNRAAALPKIDLGAAALADRQDDGRRHPQRRHLRLRRRRSTASCAACAPRWATETETIATGGLAEHIVPFTEEIDDTDDLLTLNGLRLLHERNA